MSAGTVVGIVTLIVVLGILFIIIDNLPASNTIITNIFNSTTSVQQNLSYPSTTIGQQNIPQSQVINYTLKAINQDRHKFGLKNVTYSNITSGQQHSESMLQNDYFAHWDVFGLKPYMRYTLVGGRGAVSENVAYIYKSNGINVYNSISSMEYSMMYNDSACCNNGHRFNILDPNHNQVSIGVAYNSTTIYLTEDFIDNYISWFYGTPSYGNNGDASLKGTIQSGYHLLDVEVGYDSPVQNMTKSQLDALGSYGYGTAVAGIGYTINGRRYYFPGLETLNATTYTTSGQNFDVEFNMNGLIKNYSAGEYTIFVWLTNSTGSSVSSCSTYPDGGQYCNDFVGSTYTIFINSNGQQYTPSHV
ncbi:MAG: CAP domain-containing protein [Candidatus Marsarchaeota archaeon]|nr:CAP domain-containing protein [Candidatus Marsarchaeota archaeon]